MGGSEVTGGQESVARRGTRRVASVRERVRRLPGGWVAWRVGVTVVGVAVIIGGIILLPLPGPGWLIIFAGLGLLGTEYEWAKRLLRWVRDQFRRWTAWAADQPRWVHAVLGVAGLVLIAAVAFGAWFVVYR